MLRWQKDDSTFTEIAFLKRVPLGIWIGKHVALESEYLDYEELKESLQGIQFVHYYGLRARVVKKIITGPYSFNSLSMPF